MTPILALKLLLVPSLIYAVTLAGRRWGAHVAGWLSAFPIMSGPILLFVTLEHGAAFGAAAAEGTLLAVIAISVFSVAYAWAARAFGVTGSLLTALAAYAIVVAVLQGLHVPLAVGVALVALTLTLAPRLFPPAAIESPVRTARPDDLPWRMLAGAALVLTVTALAGTLGARLSGFLAMFPVMSTVLVGFSHRCNGRAFAVAMLRGMLLGYYAFAGFCALLALLLREQSPASAFALALLTAFAVQAITRTYVSRRDRRPAPAQRPAAAASES